MNCAFSCRSVSRLPKSFHCWVEISCERLAFSYWSSQIKIVRSFIEVNNILSVSVPEGVQEVLFTLRVSFLFRNRTLWGAIMDKEFTPLDCLSPAGTVFNIFHPVSVNLLNFTLWNHNGETKTYTKKLHVNSTCVLKCAEMRSQYCVCYNLYL